MPPLVSTIIPAYNAEKCVANAIESALRQNVDQEIIVIDDGSTDSTQEIIKRYPPPVRLIQKKNGGVSSARNAGLESAKGTYIAFLDADDTWHPGKLKKQLDFLSRYQHVGTIIADERHVAPDGKIIAPSFFATTSFSSQIPGEASIIPTPFTWLTQESFVPTSSVLTRRSVSLLAGYFDEQLNLVEDRDYWIRLVQHGPLAVIPEALIDYRAANPNSLSRAGENRWARNVLFVLTTHESYLRTAIASEGSDSEAVFSNQYLKLARILWNFEDYEAAHAAFKMTRSKNPKDFLKYILSKMKTYPHYQINRAPRG